MNQKMSSIVGKTVKSVEDSACNIKTIRFTDGTELEMESVCVLPTPQLYGVEIHIKAPQ